MSKSDNKETLPLLDQLARLRASYLERLPAEFAELQELCRKLQKNPLDLACLTELRQRLHKIVGSGATFGCASLSTVARELENKAKLWLNEGTETMSVSALQSVISELETLSQYTPSQSSTWVPSQATSTRATQGEQTTSIWLVAEDIELSAELKRQFDAFNYEVRLFDSVSLAELAAKFGRPDVLIMDVTFEKTDEKSTDLLHHCPRLRALDCPLLFISDHDEFIFRVEAARLNASGFFIKPPNVTHLVKRVSEVIEQKYAHAQRVLIVDDDHALAEHMRLTLIAAGMDAEILEHSQEVMTKIVSFRPELVLMDVHMPDFSGPDLAGVIRQYDACLNLPIVYLSAETDLSQQIKAISRGSDDFLTKPISDMQLIAAVRARIIRARQLEEQISKDSLTGLFKHASIKIEAQTELLRARRTGKPMSIVILDIDHFKNVNDTHGHALGDVVIVAISALLKQRLRQSDIIGRYGGEEFVAVLPDCDAENAQQLLNEIRKRFSTLRFNSKSKPFICTVSAGIACSTDFPDLDSAQLLANADQALYDAKHSGRNRVCLAQVSAHTVSQ